MQWPQLIILTLGLCGLRWGELVALRVEDVDLQRDRLTISKSITRIGGRMVETDPEDAREEGGNVSGCPAPGAQSAMRGQKAD